MMLDIEKDQLSSMHFDGYGIRADNCLIWAVKKLKILEVDAVMPVVPVPTWIIGYQKSDNTTNERLEIQSKEKDSLLQKESQEAILDFYRNSKIENLLELRHKNRRG